MVSEKGVRRTCPKQPVSRRSDHIRTGGDQSHLFRTVTPFGTDLARRKVRANQEEKSNETRYHHVSSDTDTCDLKIPGSYS